MEFSSNVWHSSLTQENSDDLERVQKCALKIILKNQYIDYQSALDELDLDLLKDRRQKLLCKFTEKNITNEKFNEPFLPNKNVNHMKLRQQNKYEIFHTNCERYKNSTVIQMQRIINKVVKDKVKEN